LRTISCAVSDTSRMRMSPAASLKPYLCAIFRPSTSL
jgi:hypothetical protein